MSEPLQISVVGGAQVESDLLRDAEAVGRGIAEAGAVLVCGGRGGVARTVARQLRLRQSNGLVRIKL